MRANYTGVSQANLPATKKALSNGAIPGPIVKCRLRDGVDTTLPVAQRMFDGLNKTGANTSCRLCQEEHGRHLCQTAR